MEQLLIYCAAAFAAYLLGSLNGSLLMSKLIFKDDIRSHGSGNAGATNVLRTYGKKWTILVSLWDTGKGVLAVLLASLIIPDEFFPYATLTAGFFVIAGHVFPVYFGFRGGKGVFTACAVLFALEPLTAAISLAVFIAVVLISKYVSLGSICALIVLPITGIILQRDLPYVIFFALIAILIIALHSSNIKRLIKGEENKIGRKK